VHIIRRGLAMAAVFTLIACKGAEGPVGPQGTQGATGAQGPAGPPGPQGAAGAVNRADGSGVFGSSGSVTLALPVAATAGGKVPAIACYISSTTQTWLAVAQVPATASGTYCGLTGIGTSTPSITFVNGPVGWYYYAIAVW